SPRGFSMQAEFNRRTTRTVGPYLHLHRHRVRRTAQPHVTGVEQRAVAVARDAPRSPACGTSIAEQAEGIEMQVGAFDEGPPARHPFVDELPRDFETGDGEDAGRDAFA